MTIEAELRAIKTLGAGPEQIRNKLLSSMNDDFFYYEPAQEAFTRIMAVVRAKGYIPDYAEISSDPTISEESRGILLESIERPCKSTKTLNPLIENLDRYRKLRGLYFNAEETITALKKSKVDLDSLVEANSDSLTKIRTKSAAASQLVHFGRGNNSVQLIKSVLSNERPDVVPTGLATFDGRNGGFFPGSLITIAATSGGGKSAMALNLLINMASRGFDTALLPLEMTSKETVARMTACLSEIDVTKFLLGKLSAGEKKKAGRAMKAWINKLKELETRYTIFEPDEDVTIEEALFTLKPYGYKVILIDYISLLKGVDGDDSWKQLGNAARFAKVFAKNNNCIIVLLAQASNDGLIRYARSLTEHCLPASTLVDTPNGVKPIVNLKEGDYVMAQGKRKRILKFMDNGVRQTRKITTTKGFELEATGNHRVLTLDDELNMVWRNADELKSGSLVALPRSSQFPKSFVRLSYPEFKSHPKMINDFDLPVSMTPDLAYFLGATLADGYTGDQGSTQIVSIGTQSEFVKRWVYLGNKVFNTKAFQVCEQKTKAGTTILRGYLHRIIIRDAINSITGMSGGSLVRYIPDAIMSSPKEVVSQFLQGMYDGDGTVGTSVSYTTYSVENGRRLQLLLQKFGIIAHRYSLTGGEQRIVISTNYLPHFLSNIGFFVSEKQEKLQRLVDGIKGMNTGKQYGDLRVGSLLMKHYPKDCRLGGQQRWSENPMRDAIYATGGRVLDYSRCTEPDLFALSKQKALDQYVPGLRQNIRAIFDANYYWDTVVSNRKYKTERVYDLTVEDTHEFVANGVVVHNSNNSWVWTYTDKNKETGILDIRQVKARNQEAFSFQLGHDFSTMRIFDLPTGSGSPKTADGKKRSSKLDETEEYLSDITDDDLDDSED